MSHLVKPHVISIAVIATLVFIVSIWPSDDTSEAELDVYQPDDTASQTVSSEPELSVPAVLPMPSIQVLQPDPGLSQQELFVQAVNARKCRDVPKTEEKRDKWLSQADNEPPERVKRIINAFESCKNIDAAYDYMTSFKLLAIQGHEQALWQYWQLTDQEVFRLKGIHNADGDAIIAARQEFRITKYQLAEQQLLLGSERAMMRLMNAYRYLDPKTGGQNYVRSLALANLVIKLSENQDNYRRADWNKQYLEGKIAPQEAQQAMQLAEEIAKQIEGS